MEILLYFCYSELWTTLDLHQLNLNGGLDAVWNQIMETYVKHILFRILAHSECVSAQFDIKNVWYLSIVKKQIVKNCEETMFLLRRLCQSEPMWRKQNLGRRGSRKHTGMLCKENEMNAIGR